MVCPYCSEEHPVTLDRCPLTGQQLRPPPPADGGTASEARAPFGALLAEAARLYRRNLVVFVVTGSIAFIPLGALQIWSALRMTPAPPVQEAMRISTEASQQHRRLSTEEQAQVRRAMAAMRPAMNDFVIGIALALMAIPLFLATQMLSQAALVPLVGDRALGGTMGPGRAWLAVGLHPASILGTAALSTLATLVGFLLCVVPGVFAAVGFALAMPVVLLEGRRGTDALRRSWRLMSVEWPRVVGMWLVAFGAMMVLMVPLSFFLFRLASDRAGMSGLMSGWQGIGIQVSQLAISLLLFPLPVIGTTLVTLVLSHFHARGRDGIEVNRSFAHVWTLKDERIVRLDAYADQQEALEAVGLSD